MFIVSNVYGKESPVSEFTLSLLSRQKVGGLHASRFRGDVTGCVFAFKREIKKRTEAGDFRGRLFTAAIT